MHGRGDNVVGSLVAKLHDELAKIGFPDFDARLLQGRAEVDLFRHHGFRLHHGAHTEPRGKVLYISAGLFAIGRPENMSAARRDFFFELEQVAIEMIDGFPLDLLTLFARGFPVLDPRASFEMCGIVAIHAAPNNFAVHQVRRLYGSVLQEALCRSGSRFLLPMLLPASSSSCARMLAR